MLELKFYPFYYCGVRAVSFCEEFRFKDRSERNVRDVPKDIYTRWRKVSMKRSGGRLYGNRRNYSGGKEWRSVKKRIEASRSIVHGSSLSCSAENQKGFSQYTVQCYLDGHYLPPAKKTRNLESIRKSLPSIILFLFTLP